MRRELWVAGAVVLSWTVVGICSYRQGALSERLAQNKVQIRTQDSVSSRDSIRADSATKHSEVLNKKYDLVRTKVRVVHDTVFVDESEMIVVDETLSQLIVTADSTIAAQKRSLALQDTVAAGLRRGLSLRDARIKLLESQHDPRFSHGLQAGVGLCYGGDGQKRPCAYVGYGFQLRMP